MTHIGGKIRQARILVVDDEQIIALTLSAILQEHGYEVATAFNGKEAVAKAAEFFPDLLLSDVSMGGMNGIEAATRITAKLPDCKVLFLSGHVSMDDILMAAPKRLVYSLMSKPPNLLDLLNAIAYMLPTVSTAHNPAETVVDHGTLASYADAMRPTETGFFLGSAGIVAPAATHGIPDVAFINMTLLEAAGLGMRLQ